MSSVGHRQQQPQQQLVTLFVCILFLGTLLWSAECISAFRPSYSHSSTSFQRMDKRSILLKMMASISNGVPSSSSSVPVSPSPPLKIAVIGAGAAGLAAARVISRSSSRTERAAPPSVTVLEKDFQVGGIWCYSPSSSSSSVAAPSGNHVKSSNIKNNVNSDGTKMRPMYRGLRTNLPKEVMQYREFPWILMEPKDCNNNGSSSSDEIASTTTSAQVPPPSFVTHSQVADYLADYQARFGLDKYIQYGASVRQLTVLTKDDDDDGDNDDSEQGTTKSSVVSTPSSSERWPKIRLDWEVRTNHQLTQQQQRHSTTDRQYSEVFDAVMVCNGHYSQPSSPSIDGLEQYFAGNTMHSISYDDPKDFAGQTVLCIGGRASGSDLARELSFHAKEVYLSDTTCSEATTVVDDENDNQVTWVPKTLSMREDGSIQFDKNCPLHPVPDTIIFCSGYDYSFPFINDESNIELRVAPGERRVAPLYKQLWHAKLPNLAFIGLPHSVVPFPLMEFQSEAAWAQWQNCTLPDMTERLRQAEIDANSGGAAQKGRVVDTHFLGDAQWDYCRDMAKLAGLYDSKEIADATEAYIRMNKALYDYAGQARKSLLPGGPDTYRSLIFTRNQSQQQFDVVDPLAAGSDDIFGEYQQQFGTSE